MKMGGLERAPMPPAPGAPRRSRRRPSITAGTEDAGALVVFCLLAVHRDPYRWRDPLAFRVARWLEGAGARASAGAPCAR
jgi:cytochrome P450